MKLNYVILKRKRTFVKTTYKNFFKNKDFNFYKFYLQSKSYGRIFKNHFFLVKIYFAKTSYKLKLQKMFSFYWPLTNKGNLPMGKGKGKINAYVSGIKKGSLLFRFTGDFFYFKAIMKIFKVLIKLFPIDTQVLLNKNYEVGNDLKYYFNYNKQQNIFKYFQEKYGQKKKKKLYQRYMIQSKDELIDVNCFYKSLNIFNYFYKKVTVLSLKTK